MMQIQKNQKSYGALNQTWDGHKTVVNQKLGYTVTIKTQGSLSKEFKLSAAAQELQYFQTDQEQIKKNKVEYLGVNHVALLIQDLEKSLEFYQDIVGLEINNTRPNDKLPFAGAFLQMGDQTIHLMKLPDPDPKSGRPDHGGRDRHVCVSIKEIQPLIERLELCKWVYTKSRSGRPSIFFRDPDMNCIEVVQV